MSDFFRDLRQSFRSLTRTPALAVTIVLTVGLGLGAASAVFSVVNAVLLQPLPYTDSDRLVRIFTDSPPNRWPLSVADYLALKEQQTSFSSVAGFRNSTMTFNRGETALRTPGKLVTWTYFPLLGISPLHGRLFVESDDRPEAPPTVVVSHGFWMRHLNADPAVVGQNIRLDGTEYQVIGVLPSKIGPLEAEKEFFAAARWGPPNRKGPFFITALGRLKGQIPAQVALSAAQAELRAINRRLFPIWRASYQDQKATWGMVDLKSQVIGDVGTTLLVVLAAVAFVLLIASANAANLLVARAVRRSRELAVRRALGASSRRLLQHLLSESVLLSAGGAIVGLGVTLAGMRLVRTFGAAYIPRSLEIGLSAPVLWFLAATTVGSGLLFGLLPGLHAAASRFDQDLRSGGRAMAGSMGKARLRRALVAAQFAVAAPLLVGAGLLVGSLARLQQVDPGFESQNLLTAAISLPQASYAEFSDVLEFRRQALERVRALPGVSNAALTDGRPPREIFMINNFDLEDQPTPPGESQPTAPWLAVSPEYFDVMGIPLIQGRLFDERDNANAAPVAIVDLAWAKRFYPEGDAVGRRFQSGGCTTCPLITVVGVVSDVKYSGLDNPAAGAVYWPLASSPFRDGYLIVRTLVEPSNVFPSIRQAIREIDSTLPLSRVATVDELMAQSLATPRYLTILVAAFAASALILSVVGIYGVMSYFVQQRTRDIGIRIALGAGPSRVLRLIVGQGMRLAGAGVAAGVAAALALTQFMSSLLFEVKAADPLTFAFVSGLMLAAALLACALPARRAAGLDPAQTLREE